jgi:hypothetical protein
MNSIDFFNILPTDVLISTISFLDLSKKNWSTCHQINKKIHVLTERALANKINECILKDLKDLNKFISICNLLSSRSLNGNKFYSLKFYKIEIVDLKKSHKKVNEINKTLSLFRKVYQLQLSENVVDDIYLSNLNWPEEVISLDLSINRISFSKLNNLFVFPKNLKHLNLSRDLISGENLSNVTFPSTLETLDLHSNGIKDKTLGALNLPSNLRFLNLNDNNISGEGLKSLIHLEKLEYLNLSFNYIVSNILNDIYFCKKLKEIDISFNKININDISIFQNHHSYLKITL